MPATKYGQHVKTLKFKEYDQGGLRQEVVIDGKYLGIDAHVQYGVFWTAGKIGRNPDKPYVHDFDQVLLFAGSDMDDIGELRAESELCLGEEEERHVFTRSTAVVTPPLLPHWPGGILKCDKPIIMADIHPFGNDH